MEHLTEETLVRQHWKIAVRAAQRFWWPGIDADAVLSDAQLALLQALREYQPGGRKTLPQFLTERTRQRLIDLLRSRGILRIREKHGLGWGRTPLRDVGSPRDSSSEDLESREHFDWLTKPLLPNERAVVRGKFAEHKTLQQISQELGCDPARCSQLLSQALEFLRYRLSVQQSA